MTAKGFGKATPAAEKKRKTAKNIGKAGGHNMDYRTTSHEPELPFRNRALLRSLEANLPPQQVRDAKAAEAKLRHLQGDFLDFRDDGGEEAGFTHVFFNCCLHNFLALATAARLLREGGKIVISHPKGAANVEKQRRANPMLVPSRLPTERDLENACEAIPALTEAGMRVIPHSHQVGGRTREGYLKILQSFTGDSAQA